MKTDNIYLTAFLGYLLFILIVGISASRRRSLSSFAVAGRTLGLGVATATFMASFVSGVTIIGVSGYASRYGWSAAAFSCYGYALGWILLVVAAGRLHRTELTTVPEFFERRFNSRGLRIYSAGVILFMYLIVVTVQLLAMGITLHTLAGINTSMAIFIVGAVFVAYTMLGGLAAVVRTQLVQIVVLGAGVLLGATIVLFRTHGAVITAPPEHLSRFFAGNVTSTGDFVGWMLVWGLGIPTESYYLHRFYASRSAQVARMQIGIGGALVMIILLCVIICGVGAGMLIPPAALGDGALPYLFKNVIGGWICVPILFVIMSAVQSSSSGLLHIVGLYFALDVYKQLGAEKTDEQLLKVSRWGTLVFGTIVTLGSVFIALHPVPLIGVVAGISWGGMASAMFVPLFAGLFWRRATRAGAIASSLGGLFFAVVGFILKRAGYISIHEIYPGVIASAILMVIFSLLGQSEEAFVPNLSTSTNSAPPDSLRSSYFS
jgi:SSS family solute:Na+ symporter